MSRRFWSADPGRRWRIRCDYYPGPWASLGVHIDIGTPLVDFHVGWWLISLGRLYAGHADTGGEE